MEALREIRTYLDHITENIEEVKKRLISMERMDRKRSEDAWKDLMELSRTVTREWKGQDAVDEIRDQRERKG